MPEEEIKSKETKVYSEYERSLTHDRLKPEGNPPTARVTSEPQGQAQNQQQNPSSENSD